MATARAAMEGLDPSLPTEIGTTFAASVIVSTWRVNDYGLVAVVTETGGQSTYFVPWSQLKYAKQFKADPPA